MANSRDFLAWSHSSEPRRQHLFDFCLIFVLDKFMTRGYLAGVHIEFFETARKGDSKMKKSVIRSIVPVIAIALALTPALGSSCGGSHAAGDSHDIVDTAVAAGSFETLVAAVKAAGLVEVLKGDGPFTVFAPTDEAFAKLPPGTVEALLKDKEKLTAILTYHVVPGRVMAADVVKLASAKTVQGQSIAVDTSSGVKVDNANVIKTDIQASNGVIHVIDSVIIPQ
jgi:uncharacterized surface protein with fasciclin (FAS1) repeats